MHATRLLLMLLVALLYPLGATAQTPPLDEANVGIKEPFSEEGYILSNTPMPADAGIVATVCGTVSGTRFNLEPRANAKAQHTPSVDFLRNRVAAGVDLVVGAAVDRRNLGGNRTAYYVSRDSDCAPEFEGTLPVLNGSAGPLFGIDSPVVAVDPARDAVFIAEARQEPGGGGENGIGLYRTTGATLVNPGTCPNGTHTAAQASTCWPTNTRLTGSLGLEIVDPSLAVDERTSGTGAGDVYVAYSTTTNIVLAACTNTLTSCVRRGIIVANHDFARRPPVAVRPDGGVTVTYVYGSVFEPPLIGYVRCTPNVLPTPPSCAPSTLVHVETQRLARLVAQTVTSGTHPQHAHRVDANGTETYVVWARCKVALLSNAPVCGSASCICPDADVVMKASNNNGATWSALTCVACGAEDQFSPAVRPDRSRNIVNIAVYSSAADPTYQRRLRIILYHINPGGATPDPVEAHPPLTTLLDDPSSDPLGDDFGIGLGVAARGTGVDGQSRAYVHYTYHNIQGTYNGVQVPEPNNHLSRFDY